MKERKQHNKSILILISDSQFGYAAGYYYQCKYLLEAGYSVKVICPDRGSNKITLAHDNFSIEYVKPSNPWRYRMDVFKLVYTQRKKYDIFMLKQMIGISLLVIFLPKNKIYLDVRTGSVKKNRLSRFIENSLLWLSSLFFKHIFILSIPLADKLKIPAKKIHYLPLGADEMCHNNKNYVSSMKLLYIGKVTSIRNIHSCIEGFARFYNEYHLKIELSFDIIGTGNSNYLNFILQKITKNNLDDIICLHGQLSHFEASSYFQKCNYGVAFVPMTDFYEYQPSTKIFEYALSGIVCIATNTYSNKELITVDNGVLHDDNADAFYTALVDAYQNRKRYNTNDIKKTLINYSWQQIVKNNLIKVFES